MLPVAPLPEVEYPVIQVIGAPAWRQSGHHGFRRGHPAGAHVRPHRRHQPDDVDQPAWARPTSILQFDLDRDVDAAARDVQAAINAARGQLPANLPTNPSWRKVNPAESPIMVLALTSDTATQDQKFDVADSILAQKIAQIRGNRAGERGRQLAAGRPCGGQSAAAEQARRRPRSGARRPERSECQYAQGRALRRRAHVTS